MTISEDVKVDKSHVKKQIKDWKKRISDLYTTMKDWTRQTEYSFKMGAKLPMYEEPMAQSNVQPVQIDTADIYKDNKMILSIKPKGLWVIGTNGIIDILSLKGGHTLVDTAEPFKPAKWKLRSGIKRNTVDFTKQSFLNLLK